MESTKNTNNYRLERLKKISDNNNLDFIKDVGNTVKIIYNNFKNKNSRKSYLSSVMAYVRDNLKDDNILKQYNNIHKKLREQINKELKINEKDDQFIEWDELIKYRDELKNDITTKKKYLNYMILCLYTYNPPVRANYNNMLIVKKNNKNNDNLLILNDNNNKFIIKQFKTAKSKGDTIVVIKEPLLNIIKFWIEHYEDDKKIFLNMTSNQLVNLVRSILRKKFKRGSINVLRKSYLSHIFDNYNKYSNKDIEDITDKMMTSSTTGIKSYRKID